MMKFLKKEMMKVTYYLYIKLKFLFFSSFLWEFFIYSFVTSYNYLTCFSWDRAHRDVQHLLGCIRSLPSDSKSNPPNWGQLDEFLEQNFGAEASQ